MRRTTLDDRDLDLNPAAVQSAALRIRRAATKSKDAPIEVGLELLVIKGTLQHGKFAKWLRTEFGWSHSTACNYMRAAEHFANHDRRANVTANAMYVLSSPYVPEAARQEAKNRANAGERITHKKASEIRDRFAEKTPWKIG